MQEKMYCQYCGEKERLEINKYNDEYAVHCKHCGSIGPMAKDEEFAILKWNDRILETPDMPQEKPNIIDITIVQNPKRCPFAPKQDRFDMGICEEENCMMWVLVGKYEGRCGLVNTIYGTTGCEDV